MEKKYNNDQIFTFWKEKIDKNAPLNDVDKHTIDEIKDTFNFLDNLTLKYPYKPFLILCLIKTYKNNNLFNTPLKFDNLQLVKRFYDYLTNDYFLFEILSKHKSKTDWKLGFNVNSSTSNIIYKSVLNIMKTNPIEKLESKWFEIDKKNNIVVLKIESKDNFNDCLMLEKLCYKTIKNCIPWYQKYSSNEIDHINEIEELDILVSGYKECKKRIYQHTFRKIVLDRDCKCLICNAENSIILQACHIKPFSKCGDSFEQYDEHNGITFCANHHKLFDSGMFSFNDKWDIKLSNLLDRNDQLLWFHQYEIAIIENLKRFANNNKYMQFHFNNIFKN